MRTELDRLRWLRFRLADAKKCRRRLALAPSTEIMERRCLLSGSSTALKHAGHRALIEHQPVAAELSKSDGTDPHGFVIVDHHDLYGMTRQDGSGGDGTIFDFNVKTNTYTVLHPFTGSATDGSTPDHGGLLRIGHTLYGLTTEGGQYGQSEGGYGVLFRIDESGKNFKVLHSFGNGTDGIGPHGSLILYKGKLYGMTSNGGTEGVTGPGTGDGTIFQIDPSGKHYKVIYDFKGPQSDGNDGLDNVFIADGTIFGMTKDGGPNVTPDTSKKSSPYQSGVVFALRLRNR